MDIKDQIKQFKTTKCKNPNKLPPLFGRESWRKKYGYQKLWVDVISSTPFLNSNESIAARVYCIENDITTHPVCGICGKPTNYFASYGSFAEYCSKECANKSDAVKKHREQTNMLRYGVKYFLQSNNFKDKSKQTNLKKYGVENPMQNKRIQNKVKKTCTDRYGVDNIFKSQRLIEKNKELYRTGSTIKKRIKTIQKKYNRDHILQLKFSDIVWSKLNDKKWLKNEHHDNKKSIQEIAIDLNVEYITLWSWFKAHRIKVYRYQIDNCQINSSKGESDVYNYIQSIYSGPIIRNTRKIIPPLELDIYLPELKLAIEYNGNYWHSADRLPKNYHFNKFKKCYDAGILLVQIFESEWFEEQKKLKKYLKCCIENKSYNPAQQQDNFKIDPVLFRSGVSEPFKYPSKILVGDVIVWSAGISCWKSKQIQL